MNKIAWFYNRLKAMSPNEIIYRCKKVYSHKKNKYQYKNDIKIYDIFSENIDLKELYRTIENLFDYIDIKNIETCDEYSVFNKKVNLFKDIDWHKGMNGKWSSDISSYDLEFKNSDSIGDVRYSWEINRHQFMPYLAAKYMQSNDSVYLETLERHFESWCKENSFLKGVNWSSPMEIALRAYQWMIVIYILKGVSCDEFKEKLVRSVIISIDYVMKNLSLYSSANNHLILETAISSIVGYCFKDIYNQKWFDEGYRILNKEIPKQFHSDGVNKEQALHYQAFVTDMMLQYNSFLKNINIKPIQEDLIEKSVSFITLINSKDNYMDFGDSDDAKILSINFKGHNYYKEILSLANKYYKLKPINDGVYSFKDGGYSIVKNKGSTFVLDHGELGFGNLAAHGHADALAFMYSYKNKGFFIDSGTYIYNIQNEKRNYYRGTSAHSTLCYENKNQSEIEGPFLWGKKAKAELDMCIALGKGEEKDKGYIIEGKHDGYSPSIHRRRVEYKNEDDLILIYDYFDKSAKLNFILDENVEIFKVEEKIYKLTNEFSLYLYVDGNIKIENTKISKNFLIEKESIKIVSEFTFDKEHLSIISPDIAKINGIIRERSTNEESKYVWL